LHFTGAIGRLGGWIPALNDEHEWLQINFARETQVTGIATQGFYNAPYYVKIFLLKYFDDRGILQQYFSKTGVTVIISTGNNVFKGYNCEVFFIS